MAIEGLPPVHQTTGWDINPEGKDHFEVAEHLRLLIDEGYVDGEVSRLLGRPLGAEEIHISQLTWKGHEFIASIHDETVWSQTKTRVAKVGGNVSLNVLSEVAGSVAKGLIGLT